MNVYILIHSYLLTKYRYRSRDILSIRKSDTEASLASIRFKVCDILAASTTDAFVELIMNVSVDLFSSSR